MQPEVHPNPNTQVSQGVRRMKILKHPEMCRSSQMPEKFHEVPKEAIRISQSFNRTNSL
jgi:hypothetical protein